MWKLIKAVLIQIHIFFDNLLIDLINLCIA